MTRGKGLLILIAALVCALAASAALAWAADKPCQAYLGLANSTTYAPCSEEIASSIALLRAGEALANTPAYADLGKGGIARLAAMAEKGNVYALHIAFEALVLYASEPESSAHLCRAVGKSAEGGADYFLVMLNMYTEKHGEYDLSALLATFSDKTSKAERKRAVEARIKALRASNKPELAPLRDKCVAALESRL